MVRLYRHKLDHGPFCVGEVIESMKPSSLRLGVDPLLHERVVLVGKRRPLSRCASAHDRRRRSDARVAGHAVQPGRRVRVTAGTD
jgi:hypothetical protein